MSISTTAGAHIPRRGVATSVLPAGMAVALVAAALGYLLHHLPPLRDHPAAAVVAAVAVAVTTSLVVATFATRRVYRLPTVLVAAPNGAEIRHLAAADLDFCAALHAEALEHGFFVQLGRRFLREYYASFIESPHSVAYVATVVGQPVGALVGAVRPRAHAGWTLRHRGAALAFHGSVGLATHPGAAVRFIRTRLGRYASVWHRHRRGRRDPFGDGELSPAVLSHLAVVPGARGIGAGKQLVGAFESEARRAGAGQAMLTTLEGTAGAGGFYAELGWTRSSRRSTPDGLASEEWVRSLDRR